MKHKKRLQHKGNLFTKNLQLILDLKPQDDRSKERIL